MSTDNDFVARLRIRWDAMGDMANDERAAAADEIERLRVVVQGWEHSSRNAERDIETLRAERDEARWEACRLNAEIRMRDARADGMSSWFYSARQVDEERGWDCFKEVKP